MKTGTVTPQSSGTSGRHPAPSRTRFQVRLIAGARRGGDAGSGIPNRPSQVRGSREEQGASPSPTTARGGRTGGTRLREGSGADRIVESAVHARRNPVGGRIE